MLPSGLDDQIDDDEDLARFLTQSGHYTASVVSHTAFLPPRRDKATSVSRHGREPLDSLWAIGLGVVGTSDRKLYGAAIIKARDARGAQLTVHADEPPDRHAVIRDWPWSGDATTQKAQQKERALMLSRAAGAPILRPQESLP